MNSIETSELGKRYGSTWALHACTLAVPAGRLAALVGPNGAGKTTLMNILAGLTVPTAGSATVLDDMPAGSPKALDGIAFVAQDVPLYKNLSVGDMIHLTRNLNRDFDQYYAQDRLADLAIPLKRKAAKLSGGQQAQLALTLALARRPRLLILDEPLAMLDPLARQDFMATVLTAMTDGVSVLFSSHALAELERVADYLIVLSTGELQLAGEIDDLLARHYVLTGPAAETDRYARDLQVIQARRAEAQAHLLVRTDETTEPVPPGWEVHPVTLQELVMAYLRATSSKEPSPAQPGGFSIVQDDESTNESAKVMQ
jgi:ABC-2 type transport system ATP-binding protein